MKGLRHRLNDPPFVSYVGLGPFFVAWGNGLELDIGRLYFRLRVRVGRRPKIRPVSFQDRTPDEFDPAREPEAT